MGQSIKWRIDRAKVFARKLHADIDVGDEILQMLCHFSRNDVFKRFMPQREYLFRTTASIADGDQLPADFLRYADNATYTNAGSTYPVEFVPVEKIPFVRSQPLFKAYTESPKIAFVNQSVALFPAGITVAMDYYKRPADLWKSDHSVALTTTDDMPEETEYAIVRGMVERAVAMTSGREAAAELIEKQMLESTEAAVEFYRESYGQLKNDVQPFV